TGGFNPLARIAVVNNVIIDAGLSTGGASTRVGIYCKGNANGLVSGNTVNYGVAAGHDTFYGILLGATDGLRVTDNVLHASSTGIIFVSGTYTNQILARNTITATTPIGTTGATISYATENTQHPSTFANTVTFNGAVVPPGGVTGPVAITGNATVSGTVNSATISTSTVPTAAQLSGLTGGTDTSLHFHSADRARSNHTGTQSLSTVSGLITANGGISGTLSQTPITANYTALTTDQVILADATAGNITVTLPAASTEGNRELFVKKVDSSANTVRVAAAGTDTIDGAASVTLSSQYAWIDIISDGTGRWNISSASTTAVSVAASSVTPGSFASGGYTFPS